MKDSPLLIATANPGKLSEFRAIVPRTIELVGIDGLGIIMPPERGATFLENAEAKASFAARESGLLALADDSGLQVDSLAGEPGVRSARFAGEPPDDRRNRQLLLQKLKGTPPPRRTACFVCAVAFAAPSQILGRSTGCLSGHIALEERGSGGFGYDSVFLVPDGRTLAELLDEEKNVMSHRAVAIAKILPDVLYERTIRRESRRNES
ncbi:MAG: RdgB/HAM1 family non-canonical purine NTP pyrophosphatase [Chloroflexia bacterium]|nr:RdgB/HAM1 family non-canonical purine NTP pyrophosphatase [Chloroflexia bacterium]